MDNQTLSSKIVLPEQAGIQAQPGYYLVLLKKVKSGRIPHTVLQPGEWTAQPNFLKRLVLNEGHDLICIPVIADRNLRHDVTSELEHVLPGHAFKATYSLDFMVHAPDVVAIGWERDPLRQIEAEIHRMLDPISRTTPWDELRVHILRDAGTLLFRDKLRDAVDELQPFAQTRGFHVHSIRMKLELSREDQKPETKQAGWERDRIVQQIDHVRDLETQNNAGQLQAEAAKRHEEIRQVQRPGEIKDAVIEAVVKSIKETSGSERPEDFLGKLRVLAPLLNGSQGATFSPNGMGFPQQTAMLAAGNSPESKASTAVFDIASAIEVIDGESGKKQELLSLILHLIAEAYRGPKANLNEAGRYSAAIDAMIDDWGPGLDGKLKLLFQFRDFTTLQECLKP
jgi:hypothetical protein